MPTYVQVTLRNSGVSQHVYHATDEVLQAPVLTKTPLGGGERADISLAADENGSGRMSYGYSGGVDSMRDGLTNGDIVDA